MINWILNKAGLMIKLAFLCVVLIGIVLYWLGERLLFERRKKVNYG